MVFKINLATRVYFNTRLLTMCSLAVVALLGSLLAVHVVTIAKNAGEMKTLTGQITVMDEKFRNASKGVSEQQYHDQLARIAFANTIIEKKAYNWQLLLDKLEMVVPEGVAVSSILPEPKSGALKLAGTARVFANLRTFMEHLEESKFFTDVYLVNQADTKLQDKSPAINFAINCKVSMK
jgi:type IV pilus assembly protein PilN